MTLEVFFSDLTTDFVVMWEHNWPFVQGTGVQISLEPIFFFSLGVVHKLRGQDEVGGWSVKCPRLST